MQLVIAFAQNDRTQKRHRMYVEEVREYRARNPHLSYTAAMLHVANKYQVSLSLVKRCCYGQL